MFHCPSIQLGNFSSAEKKNMNILSVHYLFCFFSFLCRPTMALSLDDRLLGEKVDNYCSSDEGERDNDSGDDEPRSHEQAQPSFIPEPDIKEYQGFSTNVRTCTCIGIE